MTKKMLQHFEKRLLDERKRVLKELGSYDEAFGATPQSRRRRSEQLLVPHGRSGHRRDGAREGVPVREPGRPLPLAHRRSAAPAVPLAGDVRQVPQLRRTRSRSSGSTRCRTRATASTASSARKMQRSKSERGRCSGRCSRSSSSRRLRHEGARRQRRSCRSTCRTRCSASGCGSRSCTIPARRSGCTSGRTRGGSSWCSPSSRCS